MAAIRAAIRAAEARAHEQFPRAHRITGRWYAGAAYVEVQDEPRGRVRTVTV
jgi:hypothetical protein